jgi:hypothetical protein
MNGKGSTKALTEPADTSRNDHDNEQDYEKSNGRKYGSNIMSDSTLPNGELSYAATERLQQQRYIYIYMYTYTYMYIYIHVFICICIYIFTCI